MDARSPDLPSDSLPKLASSPPRDGSGWRTERGTPSLADMFGSVRTAKGGSFWRKLLAFLGPGYLVAVGYMDPGNWATSLAGGSSFGYALLMSVESLTRLAISDPLGATLYGRFHVTFPSLVWINAGTPDLSIQFPSQRSC